MADSRSESNSPSDPHAHAHARPNLTLLCNLNRDSTLSKDVALEVLQRTAAGKEEIISGFTNYSRDYSDQAISLLADVQRIARKYNAIRSNNRVRLTVQNQRLPHPSGISGREGTPDAYLRIRVFTESEQRRANQTISLPFVPIFAPAPVGATSDSTTSVADLSFSAGGSPSSSPVLEDATNEEHAHQNPSPVDGVHSWIQPTPVGTFAPHDYSSYIPSTHGISPNPTVGTDPPVARVPLVSLPLNASDGPALVASNAQESAGFASTGPSASRKTSYDTLASKSSASTHRVPRKPLSPESQRVSQEAGEYSPTTAPSAGFGVTPLPTMAMPSGTTTVTDSQTIVPLPSKSKRQVRGPPAWLTNWTGFGRGAGN